MSGLLANVLALLGLGFVSALVPVVNIEVILSARGATTSAGGLYTLSLAAALGQMAGKVIWYYLGKNALRWGWIRRKTETPKALARLEKWRNRTQHRPVLAGALVFASAASGFPPFAITAVLVGQLQMNLVEFVVLGLLGRWIRFAVVLGGAEWLGRLLH